MVVDGSQFSLDPLQRDYFFLKSDNSCYLYEPLKVIRPIQPMATKHPQQVNQFIDSSAPSTGSRIVEIFVESLVNTSRFCGFSTRCIFAFGHDAVSLAGTLARQPSGKQRWDDCRASLAG